MDFLNDNNPRLLKQASTLLEDLPDYIEALEASSNVKVTFKYSGDINVQGEKVIVRDRNNNEWE